MAEALASPDRAYLFIGGAIRRADGVVVLCRGNHERLEVPLTFFGGEATSVESDVELMDGGQIIELGGHRAPAEKILFEFDPAYRAWVREPPQA